MFTLPAIFVLLFVYADVTSSAVPKLPEKVFYHLDLAPQLFKEFIDKYNKTYDQAEYHRRLKIFRDNLETFNSWNRMDSDAVFGIGPLADITSEEFLATYAGPALNFTANADAVEYKPVGNAPDSLDWRDSNYVTEVKDQKDCGSCFIFSAIGSIEGQYAKLTGQLISLSEQQALDCDARSGSCANGGIPHEVLQSLASHGGSVRESDYPYENVQNECRTDKSKIVVKVTGGNQLQVSSEDDLKDAVANYGPLAVVISAADELRAFSGGILTPASCQSKNHAVLLIGYGTDNGKPYWLFKNSWGTAMFNPAEGGYFRMIRGQGACNIGKYVACATVSA